MSIVDRTDDLCPHHAVPAEKPCDRCRRPYCGACLVRLQKQWLCAGCKHALLSRSFTVVGVAAPPVAGTAAPLGSPCSAHPAEAAHAICERCGDFMCSLCTTPFEGRFYCLSCFELQWGRGSLLGKRAEGSTGLGVTAMCLGVGSLLCFWTPAFSALLAIAGVALASGALMSRSQLRGPAWVALLISFCGLALTFVWALAQF